MILLWIYVLYISVWIAVVFYAGQYGWRYTQSKIKTTAICALVFLLMYWPPFGDLIPTLWAHKQYCEKEAGFKVLITPEQWVAENPGVLEKLTPYEKFTPYRNMVMGNERFAMKFEMQLIEDLPVRREVGSIIDIETKKILSERVDFSRGYRYYNVRDWRTIKIWLDESSCYSDEELKKNKDQRNVFLKKLNML